MKTLFILFLAAAFFAPGAEQTNVLHSDPLVNTAQLVVFRKGQFAGALQNFNIFINGERTCKISNKRYFTYDVPAGEVIVASKAGGIEVFKKKEAFTMKVEAGKTYYISCDLKSSITRNRMEFSEVTENTGKNALNDLSLDNCAESLNAPDEEEDENEG